MGMPHVPGKHPAPAIPVLLSAGVELGGALKNVLAIACGISDGLGFGNNGRAALITRGLVEITRLAVALGAHPLTMGGLAGMGDLVLTCTGGCCLAAVFSKSGALGCRPPPFKLGAAG